MQIKQRDSEAEESLEKCNQSYMWVEKTKIRLTDNETDKIRQGQRETETETDVLFVCLVGWFLNVLVNS